MLMTLVVLRASRWRAWASQSGREAAARAKKEFGAGGAWVRGAREREGGDEEKAKGGDEE